MYHSVTFSYAVLNSADQYCIPYLLLGHVWFSLPSYIRLFFIFQSLHILGPIEFMPLPGVTLRMW